MFFSPSADLFSPGQSRQVSVACSPDFTRISRDFLGSSLCIDAQSQQPWESEHCFKKVMFPWELTWKPSSKAGRLWLALSSVQATKRQAWMENGAFEHSSNLPMDDQYAALQESSGAEGLTCGRNKKT